MCSRLDSKIVQTLRCASQKLTGAARRAFQAEVTRDYCKGSPRIAERTFGWSRIAVQKGLTEQETGDIIADQERSGRPSYSQRLPSLQDDIRSLVDPHSQTHPTFENTFRYTRIVEFVDAIQLPIELVYYPPYHSKYNPVQHTTGLTVKTQGQENHGRLSQSVGNADKSRRGTRGTEERRGRCE